MTQMCVHRHAQKPRLHPLSRTQTNTRTKYTTFDFFGELDPVGVCERSGLLVYVVDVQDLTHELDHWLGFVEGRGRHCRTDRAIKNKTRSHSFRFTHHWHYLPKPRVISLAIYCRFENVN